MQIRTISRVAFIASAFAVSALAGADTITLNLNSMPVGPLAGGADGRAPGNGAWWLPDNAATSGSIQAGVGLMGGNGLVVGNRGNGNDGVIDNIHSPQLNDRAGETGFNDAGNDTFVSTYSFRTASTSPVSGLGFKSESWGRDRTTWLGLTSDGAGALSLDYSGTASNGGGVNAETFTDNFYSGALAWGQWYRVETTIHFVDGPNNDTVNVKLYDNTNALIWNITDTTWENYYRQDTEQGPNGNLVTDVNSIGFQARGSFTGDAVYVDGISYSSVPAPGAAAALGLVGLVGLRRRR